MTSRAPQRLDPNFTRTTEAQVGKQATFLLLPSDLIALEAEIAHIEPFTVLHSRSKSKEVNELSALDPAKSGEDWLHLFLVRPGDVESVITQHVPAQEYWSVDALRSPVVEFQRCFFDGKALGRGRVYFVESYYDSSGALVPKPEAFRNWAQAVLSVVRRKLHRQGPDYLGRDAKMWLSSGKGTMVD